MENFDELLDVRENLLAPLPCYITANVHMVSVVKTAKVMSHHKVISDLNHATTTATATGTGQKAIRQMSKTTAT